jgi:hypothetical protein
VKDLVDQTGGSWNQVASWVKLLDALRIDGFSGAQQLQPPSAAAAHQTPPPAQTYEVSQGQSHDRILGLY